MSDQQALCSRPQWQIWLQALRAFSFTASLIPVIVGALLALSLGGAMRWELFPLVALASVLFHAGTNLVSDAGDFDRGVDREDTHGGSGVLVGGLLTSRQVFWAGILMFALGAILRVVERVHRQVRLGIRRPGW